MGKGLEGKKIALAASRKTDEMSTIIEKQGGKTIVRPLQGTVFLAEKEVEPELRQFVEEKADWVIFTTGIGTESLLKVAEVIGIYDEYVKVIQQAQVATRGYKTVAALKKINVTPVAVDEDGTTAGLINALKDVDFSGKRVMVQLHGVTIPTLITFLEEKGATVIQLLPYQHTPPEMETLEQLYNEVINQQVDAVCFTTAIQARSFFQYAKEYGNLTKSLNTFEQNVVAVAVGKVTAEALHEEGVKRIISPEKERMGAMIIELSKYYQNQENVEK